MENKIGTIGIDRAEFIVDTDKITISDNAFIETESGARFIHISEYVHNKEFKFQLHHCSRSGLYSLKLDIVFPRVFYNSKHNIYNVSLENDVKCVINKVLNAIRDNGIDIPENALQCVKLEINKTIRLNASDPSEYTDILCYALQCKPYEDTVYKNTKRRKYKFYNKTSEIADSLSLYIDEKLYRFEITLKGAESIRTTFYTDNILEISQKSAERLFYKTIDNIVSDLFKRITEDTRNLFNLFISESDKSVFDLDQTAKAFPINGSILFFEIVKYAVKEFYRIHRPNNKNYNRDAKRIVGIKSNTKYTNLKKLLLLLDTFSSATEEKLTLSKPLQKQLNQCFKSIF